VVIPNFGDTTMSVLVILDILHVLRIPY